MLFEAQLTVSFIVGGILIALQTLLGERVPLFWRGMVLTIPTTLAMGLFFIGLTKSPADVVEAARIFPAALGADYLFVAAFALLSRFGLLLSLIGSFIVFGFFGFLLISFPPSAFISSIFLYGFPAIILAYSVVRTLPQVTHLKPVPMNWKHLFFRSFLGGSVVLITVYLSKTLGNTWGGLFSAFPAAFASTFIIYMHIHGKIIIPSVAKSIFFPGVIAFIVYTLTAAFAFPHVGIWLGTLASYAATFLFFWIFSLGKKQLLNNKKTVDLNQ